MKFVIRRLRAMPNGLAWITRIHMVLPIVALLIVYQDFLHYLALFIFTCVYSVAVVYGFLHASRWSRPVILLSYAIPPFFRHEMTVSGYLSWILTAGILAWYLYFWQTVRDYYAKTPVA
jgi:hypothetical protein